MMNEEKSNSSVYVDAVALHRFMKDAAIIGSLEILSNFGEVSGFPVTESEEEFMEKKRKSSIRKWDEVNGVMEDEVMDEVTENVGDGPAISRNPMKGIEDMVEQNDNNLDGIINNLPEQKPVAQVINEDVIEEEQKKKSVIEKIRENVPEQERLYLSSCCLERESF